MEANRPSKALYIFQVTSEVRFAPSTESVRIQVEGVTGTILYLGSDYICQVVDIAERGIGAIAPIEILKDEIVELSIQTIFGSVDATCRVCYCVESKEEKGQYRLGFEFQEMRRVYEHIWRKMIKRAA